jgi:hypothetical protein
MWIFVPIGLGQVLLGLGHVTLPRSLNWPQDLKASSELTIRVSYVHTFFVGLAIVGSGLADVFYWDELIEEAGLAGALAGFLAVFWFARVVAQFTYLRRGTLGMKFGVLQHLVGIVGPLAVSAAHVAAVLQPRG